MLTKTLVKYKTRAGRVVPAFVDCKDAALQRLAERLILLFQEAVGQTFGEIEEAAGLATEELGANLEFAKALTKLLSDRCDEMPDDASVETERWQLLEEAQKIRQSVKQTLTPEQMLDFVAASLSGKTTTALSGSTLPDRLYADLPALRKISGFKSLEPRELLELYNCALVQGMLLHARSVTISLHETTLADRRAIFRLLKFHRLMAEVENEVDLDGQRKKLVFHLSGPLSLFDQAQTYGLRLATFFPHILHLPRWAVKAELQLKKKNLTLELDQKTGLVSFYQKSRSYVPNELLACLDLFNKKNASWQAEAGAEFVNIGRQSYCFPDLTLTNSAGAKVHVELFHRWHAGQLAGRLQALEKSTQQQIFVGISKALEKNPKVAALIKSSGWFSQKGFVFGEFPTPKHLAIVVGKYAPSEVNESSQ
jgi:predicted nuclease of restriction endonuclease-like RecB superfamily